VGKCSKVQHLSAALPMAEAACTLALLQQQQQEQQGVWQRQLQRRQQQCLYLQQGQSQALDGC
jgi:hypothetical protein